MLWPLQFGLFLFGLRHLLFLIFLNNQQKELGGKETIEPLVFSERFGRKSFNIQVEERTACLEKLFLEGHYEVQPDDDESTVNMADRYANIEEAFPEEIRGAAFPYFLDWLKFNVILVEITAYSDDSAYTIFESMNDRGLNLTVGQLLYMEMDWSDADKKGDVAWFERNFADDFYGVSSRIGQVVARGLRGVV